MTDAIIYRNTNFRADSLARIKQAQTIIAEYSQKLTVRQLYYQFVSRDLISNTPRDYQNLTSLIADARYAGLISWDAIEDRGREPDVPSEWANIEELMDIAVKQFRLPRWAGQKHYVELWVEKQALAGVLAPIARRNHVTLMVNKGYSSASAMKSSAERMISACDITVEMVCGDCTGLDSILDDDEEERCDLCGKRWKPKAYGDTDNKRTPVVLYLGDHDPSGEDMVRDIEDRLKEFGVSNVEVVKIALTMAQIKKFKPPPNPAKISDSRAAAYIAKHGAQSWEVDALPPKMLNQLITNAIEALVDVRKMGAVITQEDVQKKRLRVALDKIAKEQQP